MVCKKKQNGGLKRPFTTTGDKIIGHLHNNKCNITCSWVLLPILQWVDQYLVESCLITLNNVLVMMHFWGEKYFLFSVLFFFHSDVFKSPLQTEIACLCRARHLTCLFYILWCLTSILNHIFKPWHLGPYILNQSKSPSHSSALLFSPTHLFTNNNKK